MAEFMQQASNGPAIAPNPALPTLPSLSQYTTPAPQPAVAPSVMSPGPSPVAPAASPTTAAEAPSNEAGATRFVWTAVEAPSSEKASAASSPPQTNFSASPEPNQVHSAYTSQGDTTEIKLGTVAIVLICLGIFVAVLTAGAFWAMFVRFPQWQEHFGSCFNSCFGGGSSSGNHIRAFAGKTFLGLFSYKFNLDMDWYYVS